MQDVKKYQIEFITKKLAKIVPKMKAKCDRKKNKRSTRRNCELIMADAEDNCEATSTTSTSTSTTSTSTTSTSTTSTSTTSTSTTSTTTPPEVCPSTQPDFRACDFCGFNSNLQRAIVGGSDANIVYGSIVIKV